MKNIFPALIVALILTACRKDNSAFVNPPAESGSGDGCLIVKTVSPDGTGGADVKYELDSIITESITRENGEVTSAWFLIEEDPKRFIFTEGSKGLLDARTRIYLNDDGTVSKEVGLIINADGTLSEDPEETNVFSYNDKKQLVHVDVGLVDDGMFDLSYDDKGRIERIVMHDGMGTDYWIYDNFTYADEVKNDNFLPVALFGSLSSYFIPSLRNVYITGYRMSSPLAPEQTADMEFGYNFSQGKLAEVTSKRTLMGQTIDTKLAVTLTCK
ncbi:MAG TPA: hypothetical protein VGE26_10295 [Sphingobacteriaceae bacterium]